MKMQNEYETDMYEKQLKELQYKTEPRDECTFKLDIDDPTIKIENYLINKVIKEKLEHINSIYKTLSGTFFDGKGKEYMLPAKFNVYTTHKGLHIYITPPQIKNWKQTPMEIVMVQAFLGSDPFRECNNIQRIGKKIEDWNVLFTEKRKGGEVISKEEFYCTYVLK